MTKRRVAISFLVLCVVFGTALRVLGAEDKILVVVDEKYPPYMFRIKDQAKGLYPDLIEAIFSRMGVDIEIKALPWEKALKEGENGRAAVGGIYKNKARLDLYDFSEPLFEEQIAVYVKRGTGSRRCSST